MRLVPVHQAPHPLAGQKVRIGVGVSDAGQNAVVEGAVLEIVDWWDRVSGRPWGETERFPACICYAMRAAGNRIPPDDEVVYGKIDGMGHIVHVSEINW